MNRSELLQLLLKNDIPVEMRMMLCKLADLGVEFDETGRGQSVRELLAACFENSLSGDMQNLMEQSGLFDSLPELSIIYGRVVRIGEVYVRVP